jgi:acetyl esterase/lipase
MPSLQATIVKILVRATVKNRLGRRTTSPADSVANTRRMLGLGAARNAKIPRDIRIETLASPVRGEWVRANGALHPTRALLYLHGGGYVACAPLTHRTLTIALARACGAPVFVPDYRLAPENPYPAALDDALRAYDMLRAQGLQPGDIALGGDSAGGGLALATLLALRERDGLERPVAALVAYSPWTDLLATGASLATNARSEDMLIGANVAATARHYATPEQLRHPFVSPLYGEYRNSPPMLIFASTSEVLRDDAVRLAGRARSQGADVTLQLEAALPHVWPIFDVLPEARRAIAQTAAFVGRYWTETAGSPSPAPV